MKYPRIYKLLIALVVAACAFVSISTHVSRGQSQGPANSIDTHVKPTADLRNSRAGENSSLSLSTAAKQNVMLRNDLNWIFGGKTQRGWYLYVPLISQLIGTDSDVATNEFADAFSRWQKQAGLKPTGVIDQESLYSMVGHWQGRRLKQRDYPAPDQLITAPTSDFYDVTRSPELRMVERETYEAYRRLIAAAAADPSLRLAVDKKGELAVSEKYLKIISSFRSREYQDKLRKQSPHAGRAGLAVNSPHFTGRALDLYVGGEPVETKDSNRAIQIQTPVYRWLVRNAERFGFRPYYYEPWHWEYVR